LLQVFVGLGLRCFRIRDCIKLSLSRRNGRGLG
jgi:hypothetical protein